MIDYGCGHNSMGLLVLEYTPLALLAHERWVNSVGIHGDKSICFRCWYKKEYPIPVIVKEG